MTRLCWRGCWQAWCIHTHAGMTPSGRRARRFATFGSLYCLCLTRLQQHSTCCMPRVLLVCVRGRAAWCEAACCCVRYAVFSVGVSGAARHRDGHTLIASRMHDPTRGRPATADARLIFISDNYRVGRASRSSLGGRFPSLPAVLAVAALPLLGAAVRHAACARGRHCRSCSLHVVHVHA